MKSVCAKHEVAYESECPWCEPVCGLRPQKEKQDIGSMRWSPEVQAAQQAHVFEKYVDQMLAAALPQGIGVGNK